MSLPKLLLVDDDLVSGPIVKSSLKNAYEVAFETSGSMAVSRATELYPEVILLDLSMPNVDGYEVLRQMKTHPAIATIPVICVSASLDQESRDRAVALGAAGFFQKPLNVKNLATDIGALLSNLNQLLESPDKNNRMVVAFNSQEKYRLLELDMQTALQSDQKVVLLTLKPGVDFATPEVDQSIRDGKLCYLQISPALIAKFPFMQDVSSVLADLRGFLAGASSDYHLFFDDPHVIVNIQDPVAAVGRLLGLKTALCADFRRITLYASRDSVMSTPTILTEMAHIFCQ